MVELKCLAANAKDTRFASMRHKILPDDSVVPIPHLCIMPLPVQSISASFLSKKSRILRSLSVPEEEYADKSPKGSVDKEIRELVGEINTCDGLITTSSCAGRISVFLEGEDAHRDSTVDRRAVPGGKGGGKWLYTSHAPLLLPHQVSEMKESNGVANSDDYFHGLFQLRPRSSGEPLQLVGASTHVGVRYVRFSFEPMVSECLLSFSRFGFALQNVCGLLGSTVTLEHL